MSYLKNVLKSILIINKMKNFSFFIPVENYTYSFSLPYRCVGGVEYVDTGGLRHPDFCIKNQAPYGFSLLQSIAKEEVLQELNEFNKDLNLFIEIIIATQREVTHEIIDYALLEVCKKHIRKCGRLLYFDLLGYADLATYVEMAIYSGTIDTYHSYYKHSVNNVLNAYPEKVMFQNPFGGLNSWADISSK